MLTMNECTRKNTCYDCDDKKCIFKGKKESDCPKYTCDNVKQNDCENCDFINLYIDMERKWYQEEKRDQDRKY